MLLMYSLVEINITDLNIIYCCIIMYNFYFRIIIINCKYNELTNTFILYYLRVYRLYTLLHIMLYFISIYSSMEKMFIKLHVFYYFLTLVRSSTLL